MGRQSRTSRVTYSQRQEMLGGLQSLVTQGLHWRLVAWRRGQR